MEDVCTIEVSDSQDVCDDPYRPHVTCGVVSLGSKYLRSCVYVCMHYRIMSVYTCTCSFVNKQASILYIHMSYLIQEDIVS